jgi:cation diffusion facilitator family transporter
LTKKGKTIILISLVVSVLLTILKFLAYFRTYSVAILSDALESIINIAAAAFAYYSVYLSALPKDSNHPYGHGKVEFFSIGAEGAMIFIAGCLIFFKAVQYFIFPHVITRLDNGIILVAVTALTNFLLAIFLLKNGKKIRSITITGNGQHVLTDAYSTFGLIIALLLIRFTGWHWVDPAVSLLAGVIILRKGYRLLRKSVSGLMDETDLKLAEEIIGVLETHRQESWIDIHNLRIQQYGNNYHVDCHLTLPYYYTLVQVHHESKILSDVVNEYDAAGEVECFVHTQPCVPSCCSYCLLEQCPVREHPFTGRIKWTKENILPDHQLEGID